MHPKDPQLPDELSDHGMSKAEQHAATMRAATFDPSEFEGDYAPVTPTATYTSRGAQILRNVTQHRAREVRVKKAMED